MYPNHHHQAEELYMIVAGSAVFRVAEDAPRRCEAGDVVHVTPNQVHGFETREQPLGVLYVWRNGDLRETSKFVDC